MRPLESVLDLKMLFLERVCMACCGGGSTGVGSGSLEGTYIQGGDKTTLVGEDDDEV
jgi:hypothetical protein